MNKKLTLSANEIDNCSESIYTELTEKYGCQSKEAKRICLTAEEILLSVREKFGDDHSVEMVLKKHIGRIGLQICFGGEPFDPRYDSGEINDLLKMYSLTPDYIFKNAKNFVTIPVETKKKSGINGMIAAVIISAVLILLTEFFPSLPFKTILSASATPLFNTIIGFISAISGPIIFLSVLSGIIAIGDISTLKSAGLRIIRDTIIITAAAIILSIIITSQFYAFQSGSSGDISSGGTAVIQMILDIIPLNFFDPFLTGNSLQIIFIAVISGAALLTLSSKIRILSDLIIELQSIIGQIMIWVNSVMPVLVCVTILHIYLSGTAGSVLKATGAVAASAIVLAATTILLAAYISIKYKVSFALVFKKLLPTMVIAASTNSSSAAFLTNTETCRKELGIDSSLVDFGVPFGQVVCKVGIASIMACVSVCLASYYNINVTPVWYAVAVIGLTLISIAIPPIPGGGLASYSVLFALLGIPAEGLAVAIPIEMIMEYPSTAVDLATAQIILVRTADKLKKLDVSMLLRKS